MQIHELAKRNRLSDVGPELGASQGFLVKNYDQDYYYEATNWAEHFFVWDQSNQVLGYVLARAGRCEDLKWMVGSPVSERIRRPFILIDQVCVSDAVSGTGIGTVLYKTVMSRCEGQQIIAATVLSPKNKRGMKFHRKNGFLEIGQSMHADGMLRSIWVNTSEKAAN